VTTALPLDRRYLSRYASEQVGFTAIVGGQPADVDSNLVAFDLVDATTTTVLRSGAATRVATGQYAVAITSADTATAGQLIDARFSFAIGGQPGLYAVELAVGDSAPAYDALSPLWKGAVESVWVRFADLFDSPLGGPNLQVYVQTRFGRQRMAQLLRVGLGRLNTISAPHHTYSVDDGDTGFPFRQWGPLVEQALYVEVIKHLIRSYVEQPEVVQGAPVSRLDRRDYMQRWREVLDMEQRDLDTQIEQFRVASLGLGAVKALVSGGAYGRLGPYASAGGAGQAAARGYYPRVYLG
jgi:hypothetical protein